MKLSSPYQDSREEDLFKMDYFSVCYRLTPLLLYYFFERAQTHQ